MNYSIDRELCKGCTGFCEDRKTDLSACHYIPKFEKFICPCSDCLVKCICDDLLPTYTEDVCEVTCEKSLQYFWNFFNWKKSLTEEQLYKFNEHRKMKIQTNK